MQNNINQILNEKYILQKTLLKNNNFTFFITSFFSNSSNNIERSPRFENKYLLG